MVPGIQANTFSICAVIPETGEAGVAVASYCLSVGGLVPYVEPGVGAIATQAYINPEYGDKGLALLRKGLSAQQVIEEVTAADLITTPDVPETRKLYETEGLTVTGEDFTKDEASGTITWYGSRIRQLGVADMQGNTAVHTGMRTFDWAGSVTGKNFCCQGNLLAGEQVVQAMAAAFEKAMEDAERLAGPLYAALAAGEAAGGDKRGKLAAGILAAREGEHWTGSGFYCNLRVDDHPAAVDELGRIMRKHKFI